jgi:CBS domain-containing protein
MYIDQILQTKGYEVVTISHSSNVLDAVRVMVDRNIGSLVVMEGQRPVGIVTERDVLRFTAGAPESLTEVGLTEIMTRDMITAEPRDRLAAMMDVMTEKRIRHLPVIESDRLVGIISIGDLVNACRVSAEQENHQLRQYIQGVG